MCGPNLSDFMEVKLQDKKCQKPPLQSTVRLLKSEDSAGLMYKGYLIFLMKDAGSVHLEDREGGRIINLQCINFANGRRSCLRKASRDGTRYEAYKNIGTY
jgi:hypothetical protein